VQDIAKSEKRGAALGMLLCRLDKKHRTRTTDNVSLAFPQLSNSAQVEMARGMFQHFGRMVADFLRSPLRKVEDFPMDTTLEGCEHLQNVLDQGQGVLLISAHLGNFERMCHYISTQGVKVSGIARDANESAITDKVNALRGKYMEILSRGNAARETIKRLKANELVVILPDQNADEAYLPFFGKPAGTVLGPAVLHLRTKAPILPCCHLRTGPGQYRHVYLEPIRAFEGEKPEELMTRVNAAIEQMIRLAPEQYLWMHDRWKYARRRGLL
jgi:Kdo2-lipid IVA lauroyltransferase/acyltransferase